MPITRKVRKKLRAACLSCQLGLASLTRVLQVSSSDVCIRSHAELQGKPCRWKLEPVKRILLQNALERLARDSKSARFSSSPKVPCISVSRYSQ